MEAEGSYEGYGRDPSALLERVFEQMHRQRFAGLPFLNQRLRVEAIGFTRRCDCWAGILVTPWLINLMLVPCSGQPWRSVAEGTRSRWRFPAGDLECESGWETGLGPYQMCSLVAPVTRIPDQATARLIARRCLSALLTLRRPSDVPTSHPADGRYHPPAKRGLHTCSRRRFLGLGR